MSVRKQKPIKKGLIVRPNIKGEKLIAVKPNRNAPCKCKSGKKTKNCCGADTKYYSTKPKVA